VTNRRAFLCTAAGIVLVVPLAVLAQQRPRRIAKVAILSPGMSEARSVFTAFRSRLRELGYEEGRDVVLEFHFAKGSDGLAALAQAIAREGADVVLADGGVAARAMRAASPTIPIVTVTSDPVGNGLAASLARPGGNVTGVASLGPELMPKQLELLREILPSARRIGVIAVSMSPETTYRAIEERAASLGVALRRIVIRTQVEAEHELAPTALRDVDGLVLLPNPITSGLSATLVRLINAAGKPAIYGDRDFVAVGGLVFYGFDIDDSFRLCANVVDRVLKGASPATMPFEQPARIALVLNLKSARALGLKFPPSVIARADEVIQ
jgi:putative ABC transport system substrate-binding protein